MEVLISIDYPSRHFTQKLKHQHHPGVRRAIRGSPEWLGFILWWEWKSAQFNGTLASSGGPTDQQWNSHCKMHNILFILILQLNVYLICFTTVKKKKKDIFPIMQFTVEQFLFDWGREHMLTRCQTDRQADRQVMGPPCLPEQITSPSQLSVQGQLFTDKPE